MVANAHGIGGPAVFLARTMSRTVWSAPSRSAFSWSSREKPTMKSLKRFKHHLHLAEVRTKIFARVRGCLCVLRFKFYALLSDFRL
eukprot:3591975-Pyramimonas_sp.AAC.1